MLRKFVPDVFFKVDKVAFFLRNYYRMVKGETCTIEVRSFRQIDPAFPFRENVVTYHWDEVVPCRIAKIALFVKVLQNLKLSPDVVSSITWSNCGALIKNYA